MQTTLSASGTAPPNISPVSPTSGDRRQVAQLRCLFPSRVLGRIAVVGDIAAVDTQWCAGSEEVLRGSRADSMLLARMERRVSMR